MTFYATHIFIQIFSLTELLDQGLHFQIQRVDDGATGLVLVTGHLDVGQPAAYLSRLKDSQLAQVAKGSTEMEGDGSASDAGADDRCSINEIDITELNIRRR